MLNHNMNRFKKRERTQNWAYEEKRFLLELCRKDMKIIENKRLDSSLTALKNKAWKIIHQQFTSTFGTDRDCNRLKEQWRRMKACTRAEMMDYEHRITRFGQEIADRKRPSPFSFEIWDFMQEAKRACKSEIMDDVDYSKWKLSLEENLLDGVILEDEEEEEEDNTMWSYLREKSTQNICEVEIKEETPNDDYNYNSPNGKHRTQSLHNCLDEPPKKKHSFKSNFVQEYHDTDTVRNDSSGTIPSLSINNVVATFDTLNLLKNNSKKNNSNDDNSFKQYLDMQIKEHMIRMQILQVELETAKFNRDTAEINRQLCLKKFNGIKEQETNS